MTETVRSSYQTPIYSKFIKAPLDPELLENDEFNDLVSFLKEIGAYPHVSDGEWHVLKIYGEVYVDGVKIQSSPTRARDE